MFTKRTIRAKHEVTKVDTADEALAVSLAEKAKIDIAFMEKLSGKTEQQLYEDLHGVIFLNPEHEISPEYEPKYLTDQFSATCEMLQEIGFKYYTVYEKRQPEYFKLDTLL